MKTITILGATGVQGSSVVGTFIESPDWNIRAITRDVSTSRAKLLKQRFPEIELIEADTGNVESLTRAFAESNAIFAVTNYWAPFKDPDLQKKHATGLDPGDSLRRWAYEDEIKHGKNIAAAAAQVGASLQYFIWSSLPSCSIYSKGKYSHIYHFDAKAVITQHIMERHPDLAKKMSVLLVGFYASNMLNSSMMHPIKQPNGSFLIQRLCPERAKLPFIITDQDIGRFVKLLINTTPGKTMLGYTAMLSWGEMAQIWGEAVGQKVTFREVDVETFKKEHPLVGEELLSATYAAEFGYAGGDPDVMEPGYLGVADRPEEIQEWLKRQDWSAVLNARPVQS